MNYNGYSAITERLIPDPTDRLIFDEKLDISISLAKREGWHGGFLYVALTLTEGKVEPAFEEAIHESLLERLREQTRGGDALLLLDESALVWLQKAQADQIATVAARIRDSLQAPLELGEEPLTYRVEIGIALYPFDGKTLESLLERAYEALEQGRTNRNPIQMFDPLAAEPPPTR